MKRPVKIFSVLFVVTTFLHCGKKDDSKGSDNNPNQDSGEVRLENGAHGNFQGNDATLEYAKVSYARTYDSKSKSWTYHRNVVEIRVGTRAEDVVCGDMRTAGERQYVSLQSLKEVGAYSFKSFNCGATYLRTTIKMNSGHTTFSMLDGTLNITELNDQQVKGSFDVTSPENVDSKYQANAKGSFVATWCPLPEENSKWDDDDKNCKH